MSKQLIAAIDHWLACTEMTGNVGTAEELLMHARKELVKGFEFKDEFKDVSGATAEGFYIKDDEAKADVGKQIEEQWRGAKEAIEAIASIGQDDTLLAKLLAERDALAIKLQEVKEWTENPCISDALWSEGYIQAREIVKEILK